MIKPKQLKRGDTIAVLAPSSALAYIFPHVFQNGIKNLKEIFEFKVIEYPTTQMSPAELSANPKIRGEEINQAFKDKNINGIITAIGGEDSIRILQYLNIDIIKENPKFFMGFSDSTTFLSYLNFNGLVTYYGASIMAGFSQIENFPQMIEKYKNILFKNDEYKLQYCKTWASSYKNWADKNAIGEVEKLRTDDTGFRWLNKSKNSEGKLWGGCIEVIAAMLGSNFFPPASSDFWNDKILMLETSREQPDYSLFRGVLRNLAIQGILNKLKGLIIGKPKYETKEKHELDKAILSVVIKEFNLNNLNIISNIEFGHADPKHILPMGINMQINTKNETIHFTEKLFS